MTPRPFHHLGEPRRRGVRARITAWLAREPQIVFAFLYGSFLTDPYFRDIDIGIWVDEVAPADFPAYETRLAGELEKELGFAWPVEVRIVNAAPVSFVFQVVRGRLPCSRDDERLAEVMETTARRYLDQEPLRRRYIREAMG